MAKVAVIEGSQLSQEPRTAKTRRVARRWSWLLGFSLPLSGGLTLSLWLPDYPDWLTIIRLVTLAILLWLLGTRDQEPLPKPQKRMLWAFGLVMVYATASLMWAPSLSRGFNNLVSIGLAASTAVAVLLLVRDDRLALRAFTRGALVSGAFQVLIALAEVSTGRHLSTQFGSAYIAEWNLGSIEDAFGTVAFGSLGNPNDLGGYLLFVSAIFLSRGAFGAVLRRPAAWIGWGFVLLSAFVAFSYLNDARAFRLGLLIIVCMHVLDRIFPPDRSKFRLPVMLLVLWAGISVLALWGASLLHAVRVNSSDDLRLTLIGYGLGLALASGGLGRGIGTEQALIDTGALPLNFHNVVVQMAAELGFIVAGVFLVYLLVLVVSWAFATRSARRIGREVAVARATLAVALLVYGTTSSGVLESPSYWAFLALTAVLSELSTKPDNAAPERALQRTVR